MIVRDVAPVSEGLIFVRVTGTSSAVTACLWTRGTARKRHQCVVCMCRIERGDHAYRPTRDTDYRMARLCEVCAVHPTLQRGRVEEAER